MWSTHGTACPAAHEGQCELIIHDEAASCCDCAPCPATSHSRLLGRSPSRAKARWAHSDHRTPGALRGPSGTGSRPRSREGGRGRRESRARRALVKSRARGGRPFGGRAGTMAVGKNKRLTKGGKKGAKKKV